MERFFNTGGPCKPKRHYMLPFDDRLPGVEGRIERELAVGTGRADLIAALGGREDVLELKLWRGKYTFTEGLDQVARYAKRLGRDVGYLVIFDPKAETPWEDRGTVEEVDHEGITAVVVRA